MAKSSCARKGAYRELKNYSDSLLACPTPIEIIVKFVNADITSPELIDGGIELLNGNGIRAPLAAEKDPHQALLSYQNWIWWRIARSFRSVLETVHAMLPCRTMRYFRADRNMTGLMTKCSA
jgi:hypothetical protein